MMHCSYVWGAHYIINHWTITSEGPHLIIIPLTITSEGLHHIMIPRTITSLLWGDNHIMILWELTFEGPITSRGSLLKRLRGPITFESYHIIIISNKKHLYFQIENRGHDMMTHCTKLWYKTEDKNNSTSPFEILVKKFTRINKERVTTTLRPSIWQNESSCFWLRR